MRWWSKAKGGQARGEGKGKGAGGGGVRLKARRFLACWEEVEAEGGEEEEEAVSAFTHRVGICSGLG